MQMKCIINKAPFWLEKSRIFCAKPKQIGVFYLVSAAGMGREDSQEVAGIRRTVGCPLVEPDQPYCDRGAERSAVSSWLP